MKLGLGQMLVVIGLVALAGCAIPAATPAPTPSATLRQAQGKPTATPADVPIPPTDPPTATATPVPTGTTPPGTGRLVMDFPLETTELKGGQGLRVGVSLVGPDDEPVAGATVQAELWAPDGDHVASFICADKGAGRYLADRVPLPLRGAAGTWRVFAGASWAQGGRAEEERTVLVLPSLSDRYRELYGFWVEPPSIFALNMAMYNLHSGGLHFEDHFKADGSGRVVLDNYRYTATGSTFADLNVYWEDAQFPENEAGAVAHVEGLGRLYRQAVDSSVTVTGAERRSFQDRSAWRLAGEWRTPDRPRAGAGHPVEWTVFRCPHSDWLWTLVIYADGQGYMDDLRAAQATFECPTPGQDE